MRALTVSGVIALFVCGACGTYSMVRPARTLPAGQHEIAVGMAASQLEVNTIGHVAYGITNRVEVLAQNEVWNTFAEARVAIVPTGTAPIVVTAGLGGGVAITMLSAVTSSEQSVNGLAGTASLAIGRDVGRASLSLSNRSFFLAAGYLASATRAGVRIRAAGAFGVFGELGATYHALLAGPAAGLLIGEGAAGIYVAF